MKLPKLPLDKQAHFYFGAALCFAIGILIDPMWGLVAAGLAGAAKEIWDRLGNGTPDWMDLAATVLGGVVAFIVFAINDLI